MQDDAKHDMDESGSAGAQLSRRSFVRAAGAAGALAALGALTPAYARSMSQVGRVGRVAPRLPRGAGAVGSTDLARGIVAKPVPGESWQAESVAGRLDIVGERGAGDREELR